MNWAELEIEAEERGYEMGKSALAREIMRALRPSLGSDRKDANHLVELSETRSVLRRVCAKYGDNDWDDDLHLADVVAKHLENHLEAKR